MAEQKRDYYEVLGVQKTASDDEIKKAYRKLAKDCHPDLHPDDKAAEERFKELNEAYAILSDPEQRKKYDNFGHAAFDPNSGFGGGGGFNGDFGGFGGFGDILNDLFGGGFGGGSRAQRNPNAPQRGEDLRVRLTLTFEEAAFGCTKEINVNREEKCADCGGTGCADGGTAQVCDQCHGSGTIRQQRQTAFGMMASTVPCPKCRGTGKIILNPCKTCGGSGRQRKSCKISVKIPAGIDNGQAVSLRGQGNSGINGGPYGDIIVSVTVRPHEIFERDGMNIYSQHHISMVQAALGADVEVPTLDGKVRYPIPEGTQSGTTFRLRNKGVPNVNKPDVRGDQYVEVIVDIPKKLNSRQKELLTELGESLGDDGLNKKKKKR